LPDRILDGADIVSLGLGFGWGFHVNAHVTRYASLPAFGSYTSVHPISWGYNRNLNVTVISEREFGVGPILSSDCTFTGAGTGWKAGLPGEGEIRSKASGMVRLTEPVYAEGYRDPWAIGAAFGPLLIGPDLDVDIHPVELADLVAGLVTLGIVDLRQDDLATRFGRAAPSDQP
jgi:hypothetical protein